MGLLSLITKGKLGSCSVMHISSLFFLLLFLILSLFDKLEVYFDAFELWRWRRVLRVSWTARRSNQSILKEINPEYSLEGLMLKLKLQYFGHLMQTVNSLENTLMLGKTKGKRRRGQQRMMVGWHH